MYADEPTELPSYSGCWGENGGESGIRTHGRFPYGSFQDCSHKPLDHLSRLRGKGVSMDGKVRAGKQKYGNDVEVWLALQSVCGVLRAGPL